MAANTVYITAGLPRPKDAGQSPTSQVNTAFVTAGLPKIVEGAPVTIAPTSTIYGPLVGPLGGAI